MYVRVAVIALAVTGIAIVSVSGRQQRMPGVGSGVVDVKVVEKVAAAQQGDWRVGQQGEWKVGVQGSVATLPSMPPLVAVGRTYDVRWPGAGDAQYLVIRELHPSGWARVTPSGSGRTLWVNLANAASIEPR